MYLFIIILWKVLEIYKAYWVITYSNDMSIATNGDLMEETDEYDTVKWTPSNIFDPSENVMEYNSYWIYTSVILLWKMCGWRILVPGRRPDTRNGVLNIVYWVILSYILNIEEYY